MAEFSSPTTLTIEESRLPATLLLELLTILTKPELWFTASLELPQILMLEPSLFPTTFLFKSPVTKMTEPSSLSLIESFLLPKTVICVFSPFPRMALFWSPMTLTKEPPL